MNQETTGNLLILQVGEPCAVANAALASVISAALNHDQFANIYGARKGFMGVINEELIDLAEESQQMVRALMAQPGMALMSTKEDLRVPAQADRAIEVLRAYEINAVVIIGDGTAQTAAQHLSIHAHAQNYALQIITIPTSAENNLPVTDHCLGYGSFCKSLATAIRTIACDLDSCYKETQVFILEVPGRISGWMAAGAALAKFRHESEYAPHLIYMPEHCLSADQLASDVQRVLRFSNYCVIVASEGVRDQDGNFWADQGGASVEEQPCGSLAQILQNALCSHLQVKVQTASVGPLLRSQFHTLSKTDVQEAALCGQAAIAALVSGKTDRMVTLTRAEGEGYRVETGLVALGELEGVQKAFPAAWLSDDQCGVTNHFSKYALALIQGEVEIAYENGTPRLGKLRCNRVPAILPVAGAK